MRNTLRELIFRHWEAKLVSFLLATAIWAVLKATINPGYMDQLLTGTIPNH
jgi:hypothetical protein